MKLVLRPDNEPAASVVIEPDSPPAVSFAASELSRYLAILTGGRFLVCTAGGGEGVVLRLRVASPDLTPPAPLSVPEEGGGRQRRGAYEWRVHERGVEIVGETPVAVLHAVYALLETLGCRWLHPRDGGEIVPRIPQVELPLGEHCARPAMAHRELTNLYAIDREYPLHIDWMAKNRLNRFMAFLNVHGSLEAFETFIEPELAARGMAATLGHHSFRFLLPPEEHFAEHPEWYALIGGERRPAAQLCTSNAEVVEAVAGRIAALFDAHPTVETFGLWPNDGYGWCECAECAKLEPQTPSRFSPQHPRRTDSYLRFVNAVAEIIARTHPDRRLSALAYVNYADAPETVRPAANVAVCFAPFLRCLKHPLQPEVECERMNVAYAREFERWREATAADLYLFSYLSQIHTLSLPYPIHEMLRENWRWLADAGCDGFTMEFVPEEWGAFGANLELIARLAWEPETDVPAWLAERDEAVYGPAAAQIGEYRRRLAEVLVEGGPCTGHYDLTWARRADERTLRAAMEALGRARVLAATGEKRHWQATEQAWVGLGLLLRVGSWQRLLASGREGRALAARAELLEFAREHAKSGALDLRRYERVLG